MDFLKRNKYEILIVAGYILLVIPICMAIFYSVPMSDDFANGAYDKSSNYIGNAIGWANWHYMNWSGRWLTYFIQKMINPLNLHTHLGHIYGSVMIAIFVINIVIIIKSIKFIVGLINPNNELLARFATLIIVAILLTTNYYSQAYHWFVGATAYALPFAMMLLTVCIMLRFFRDEEYSNNKILVLLVLAGGYPAVNEIFDIPMGIIFLYIALKNKKNIKNWNYVRSFFPLLIYVLLGSSNVFAPGNFVRKSIEGGKISLLKAFKQTFINLWNMVSEITMYHPLIFIFLGILLIIGIWINKEHKKENGIISTIIVWLFVTYGSLFPYVYGRGFSDDTVDDRMEYIVEYILIIGFSIIILKFGKWVSYKTQMTLTRISVVQIMLDVCVIGVVFFVKTYDYRNIVQLDILRSKELIVESYTLWDGILKEIEESPDDNVVIHRDHEMSWTKYFTYSGITDNIVYNVPADTVYAPDNGQQLFNVYYGKESILLIYDNEL